MKKIIYLPLLLFTVSCWNWKTMPPEPEPPLVKVMGYVPVYTQDPSVKSIYADAPRPMKYPGKIYVKGNLIFQNDLGYGIHVIDKSDPSNLKKVGFINLRGNLEMSIKGNLLYANCFRDLVVLDISNWQSLKEIQRISDAFKQGQEGFYTQSQTFIPLPEKGVFFECINESKGIHSGWRRDSVYQRCFY